MKKGTSLEPFRAEQRHQQVDKQQHGDRGGKYQHEHNSSPNSRALRQTRRQAAMNANRRPMVTRPRRNIAGSQMTRFMFFTATTCVGRDAVLGRWGSSKECAE